MFSCSSCFLCHDYLISIATLLIRYYSNLCFVNEKCSETFSRQLLSWKWNVRASFLLTLVLTQLWRREGEPGPYWNQVRGPRGIFLKHLCCFWWAVGRISFKAHFKDHLVHQIIPDFWGRRGLCSYLYTTFFLSWIFCLLCSEMFIKGPNMSVHRELWVLVLKAEETGNRIGPAQGARKELSYTFKVKQILSSPDKHLLPLPQELKLATFFWYLYFFCEIWGKYTDSAYSGLVPLAAGSWGHRVMNSGDVSTYCDTDLLHWSAMRLPLANYYLNLRPCTLKMEVILNTS